MKGVILAGGTGSRLYPLTKVTNKHLLPVYDEPMIFKPIKTLRDSGITDIIIVLGGESIGDVVRVLGNGKEFDVKITYVYQEEPRGIADALYTTRHLIHDEKIAVILGDNVFGRHFKEEIKEFENQEQMGCYLFLKEVMNPKEYGMAILNEKNEIIEIEEKPDKTRAIHAVTGFYLYDKDVFEKIESMINIAGSSKKELGITGLNNLYLKDSLVKGIIIEEDWFDAGTKKNLLDASNYIARL